MRINISRSIMLPLVICSVISVISCSNIGTDKMDSSSQIDISKEIKDSIRYIKPVFKKVEIKKDIVFSEVTNYIGLKEKLLLDIYTPSGDEEENRPVILWVHGGGFRVGNDKTQEYIVRLATEFAKRGYVSISTDYRLRGNPYEDWSGTLTDSVDDVMSAIEWIRNNDKEYKIDKNSIAVGGGSAGGIISVNLCYKDNGEFDKRDKEGIFALIDLWGSPDQYEKMYSEISKTAPPTIIIHGTADKDVPFINSVDMAKELEDKGVCYELHQIKNAGHTPVNHMNDIVEYISLFLYKELNRIKN